MILSSEKRLSLGLYGLIFLVGGVLGTLFDYIHVYFGVLEYTSPHFFGTSLFVPIEFGFCGVFSLLALPHLSKKFGDIQVSLARIIFDSVLLFLAYTATGVFKYETPLVFVILTFLAILSVATRLSKLVFISAIICAIIGPFSEFIVSSTGFFQYTLFVIPPWLPLLWIIASGLFLDLTVYFKMKQRV